MDREFIEKNQIVERYLTGKLPPKGVADFERVCRTNPALIEELGLAERVNSAIKLLEASGQPEPWQEKPRAFWEKPPVIASAAALALILAITSGVLYSQKQAALRQVDELQAEVTDRPIAPTSSERVITVIPSRTGPVSRALFSSGGEPAELLDLRFDLSWSKSTSFRVTIERKDQGRVLRLHNLLRDSNGNVRVALNNSVLGPGLYTVTIEALDWRGQPEPAAWATFQITG